MANAAVIHVRGLEAVELAKVTDNPWQPRFALNPDQVKEIADSIEKVGLLQPPMVRRAGEGYQTAFGHYRLAALKSLGVESVELEVRDLSDSEMAIIALTENRKRSDVTAIEQYRAWQKTLEIEGMTIATLAESLGLDRSTVSNNLRLLKLPGWILKHVDEGDMSPHAAREFLCLLGADDHFHDDVAKQALNEMTRGVPDWRAARVRKEINEAIVGRSVTEWRKLFSGYAGGGHQADPSFDLEKFKQDQAPKIHTIPSDTWSDAVWRNGRQEPGRVKSEASREWTCATSAWTSRASAAKKAAEGVVAKASAAAPAAAGTPKTGSFTKVLAADPVLKAVSAETAGTLMRALAKDEVEASHVEALGTRATPALIGKGKDVFKALIDERSNIELYGTNSTHVPSYFPNLEECRKTCTIGATYGRFSDSGNFALFCLNQEHFEEKAAKGRQAILAKTERVVAAKDEADSKILEVIRSVAGKAPPALTAILSCLLLSNRRFEPILPPNTSHMDRDDDLAQWSANDRRIFDLLKQQPSWWAEGGWRKKIQALPPEESTEMLHRLLVKASGDEELAAAFAALTKQVKADA